MNNEIVVRFAPSPTGMLHIGSARTALFNYLFAKKNNGKFLLRIEDTDKARSTQEAVDAILNGLKILGINYDGEIVLQSENFNNHLQYAKKMIANGTAYYAYDTEEELSAKKEEALQNKKLYKYDGKWRDNSLPIPKNVKPVIRLKVPDGITIVDDISRGKIEFNNKDLDDLILVRSDGTPTYMLAVVVDDVEMNITHIIRGDDHLSNTPKQCLIYKALGHKVPVFCHIPMIQDKEGKKLSKRKCAASVEEYIDMGYLPDAIVNYLLHLGGCYTKDIITINEAISEFDIYKLGKSPSRFDFEKLKNINLHYIKSLSINQLIAILSVKFDKQYNIKLTNENINSLKVLAEELTKYPLIIDIINNLFPIFDNKFDISLLKSIENSFDILKKFLNFCQSTYITKESLHKFLNDYEIKMKEFGMIIRITLVGKKDSFSIINLINSLDKKEIIFRIERAIAFLNVP